MTSRNSIRLFSSLALCACAGITSIEAQVVLPPLEPAQTLVATNDEAFPGPPGNPPDTLFFGDAIAVHGKHALIGMPAFDGILDTIEFVGRVAAFSRDRSGNWQRSDSLDASDQLPHNRFGERVALSDRVALVGAETGVYVFRRDRGGWRQTQKIGHPSGQQLDGALALDERFAFIGATIADEPGAVRAYRIDQRGRLQSVQTLTSGDGEAGDAFGQRLALDGDTLVVGAHRAGETRGAAYVFGRAGRSWTQRQKLIAMNGAPGDEFGATVAIVGNRIAIGAPGSNAREAQPPGACGTELSGAVLVFTRHHRTWSQREEVVSPVDCTFDFGVAMGLSRDWLVSTGSTIFALAHANPAVFERTGGSYVARAELRGPEGGAPTIAVAGSTVFLGLPSDRAFSTGQVLVYRLARGAQQ